MNEVKIYDKAKWHYEGEFPIGVDRSHALTHTAFFLGWLVNHRLTSRTFEEDFADELKDFRKRRCDVVALFFAMDGVFTSEELSDEGKEFTDFYFEFERGDYLSDFEKTLASKLSNIYLVEPSWENFDKIGAVIDGRFSEFKKRCGM